MVVDRAPQALGVRLADRRVVACLGAGGVGKTTTSAAVAVGLCAAGRRVLCLTIDPARRLADSLGIPRDGGTEREVPAERLAAAGVAGGGRLHVSLLDAAGTFAQVVRRSAPDAATAERVLSNRLFGYLSGSLPGVQEVMALERLFAAREDPRFDVIVLDTPPTAHALDFLDAPRRLVAALDSPFSHWLTEGSGTGLGAAGGRSMRFVLRLLARLAGPGLLEEMSRLLGDARTLLPGFRARALDGEAALRSDQVAFVVVTSVQPQAIDEAAFVHDRLAALGREGDVVVVNRVRLRALRPGEGVGGHRLPAALAERLAENLAQHERLAAEDEAELRRLVRRCGAHHRYYRVPAFASDVRDLAAVAAVARVLFAADAVVEPEPDLGRDPGVDGSGRDRYSPDRLAGPAPATPGRMGMMSRETGRVLGGHVAHAPAAARGEGASGKVRRRVLLVEDNRNLRLTTARMLEHLGYAVTAVDNGPAAVEIYRQPQPPDVAILDLGLPGMGGREVLRSIRTLTPDARVVLCSGAPEDLAAATEAGGPIERLVKPYDLESLAGVLVRILAT